MARLRLRSLAARLIAAAAIWTMLGLALGGFVLSRAFRDAAQSNFDSRLTADMDGLIAAADPDQNGALTLQDRFVNHQFDRVYSGLYFQIKPVGTGQGGLISRSLFDRQIAVPANMGRNAVRFDYADGPDNQHLRTLSRRVEFPITATPDQHDSRVYIFTVAGDLSQVEAESRSFNGVLIWSFVILGLGLVTAVFVQVRVGLQPLRRLKDALARIRDGKAQRLEGNFPAEIAPLADELNSLIAHSAEVVARARSHVSNLAHFLKTPLTVLAGEAEAARKGGADTALADQVQRQVTTMRRQVDHYLARARVAGNVSALGNRTKVAPVLADLARVLERIHAARAIAIDCNCPPDLYFRGERQDLEEMAGNLMDNGCKWAHSRVVVTAAADAAQLILSVEDDGAGLTGEERAKVGTRGERLDESVPGSGLGLAIVRDISKIYGGSLTLDSAGLGGLKALLTLPLARPG